METAQQRLERLFDAALEITNAAERTSFLQRECAGDATLQARVERLLAAHEKSGQFFDDCRPALKAEGLDQSVVEASLLEEETGKTIGPYKLLQKIGEGGCGVVYMAQQDKPVRRRVALKIIKLGMDTKNVIARFEAERQALAMMDHPNIARVLDVGATETGRPYFVMELVHGLRITEYCDQRQFDTRQRLDLFIQVCHAIQHAHQKGIIHRDIKPSNVLVTQLDGAPVPKVIDFGIAKAMGEKLTDKTLFTVYGHFIGTPAYMSPEQADFSDLDVDTRSDIYSLGVLLYELLTGKTPFEQSELLASGIDQMRKTLREREPHRPSTKLDTLQTAELTATAMRRHVEPPKLQSLLQGDLDWIVMKALEKDRKRRYETANGLAMDIRRFLDNEPVMARPPSRLYRFQKLVRRNRGVFAATTAVALALFAGLSTATWLFLQEREQRHRAVAAEQFAESARANEAALRRQAETREKITQAAFFISQGKWAEADAIVGKITFQQPTLDGAAVLRTLGEWNALNGRWPAARNRFLAAVQVDQLDKNETIAQDFLSAAACLATAGDTAQFQIFCHDLAARFADEKDPALAEPLLRSELLLPGSNQSIMQLSPLTQAVNPSGPSSIGNPRPFTAGNFLSRLKLQTIGPNPSCSIQADGTNITFIAGGANIWGTNDEFGYACTAVDGDFDFRMQVKSVLPELDNFTRVGLMARESADRTGSRHVMVAVNAENSFQVVTRSAENADSDSVPHNPLPAAYGSNSWVRLQRVGPVFHAYTSSNGVDWAQLYQTTGGDKPFSDPIFFGIAASAHSTNSVSTNIMSYFGVTPTVSPETALTLALYELRRGNAAKSAEWCRRLLIYPDGSPIQDTTAQVILSLACEQLGQTDEAHEQLAAARQNIEKKISSGLDAGNRGEGFWFEWVFAQTLLAEAQGVKH